MSSHLVINNILILNKDNKKKKLLKEQLEECNFLIKITIKI